MLMSRSEEVWSFFFPCLRLFRCTPCGRFERCVRNNKMKSLWMKFQLNAFVSAPSFTHTLIHTHEYDSLAHVNRTCSWSAMGSGIFRMCIWNVHAGIMKNATYYPKYVPTAVCRFFPFLSIFSSFPLNWVFFSLHRALSILFSLQLPLDF